MEVYIDNFGTYEVQSAVFKYSNGNKYVFAGAT